MFLRDAEHAATTFIHANITSLVCKHFGKRILTATCNAKFINWLRLSESCCMAGYGYVDGIFV